MPLVNIPLSSAVAVPPGQPAAAPLGSYSLCGAALCFRSVSGRQIADRLDEQREGCSCLFNLYKTTLSKHQVYEEVVPDVLAWSTHFLSLYLIVRLQAI